MTAITPDLANRPNLPTREDNYLTHTHGVASWLFTLDHKRIGMMYLVSVLISFLLGGIFALIVRTQLLTPAGAIWTTADQFKNYNIMFTLHGAVMIFLVLIPGIPGALGNFILPIMLGAKDVAFPRLNLMSYYLYVIGAIFAIAAIVFGGVDTGWTFYTPYSIQTNTAVSTMLLGAFILGFSSILTGMNFIVTMHKLRPSGMTWFRMPLMLWALYATSVIQILATPVLGITLLLIVFERLSTQIAAAMGVPGGGIGIFDPAMGGDPVLMQHFFWFYSHPAVYIMILPAMGIMSEVIATHCRRHIFGYRFVALSSMGIAIIGFLVWGHHMFPNGQSSLLNTIFSFLTMAVAIPSAIKVWNWLATMYRGSISFTTPMCYALIFLFLFAIGGLTGIYLGSLATDFHLHDTYFVIAHFHYVMFGGTLIGFLAGLHHWWPKMTGRMYNETLGRLGSLGVFIGFNATFFPQFVMGSHGMSRRYASYQPEFYPYHVLSSIGAYIQLAAFMLIAAYLLHSLFKGKKAPANPWGAATLEWTCSSPPPHDNFAKTPVVGDPYDMSNVIWDEKIGGYVRDNSKATEFSTTAPISTQQAEK